MLRKVTNSKPRCDNCATKNSCEAKGVVCNDWCWEATSPHRQVEILQAEVARYRSGCEFGNELYTEMKTSIWTAEEKAKIFMERWNEQNVEIEKLETENKKLRKCLNAEWDGKAVEMILMTAESHQAEITNLRKASTAEVARLCCRINRLRAALKKTAKQAVRSKGTD